MTVSRVTIELPVFLFTLLIIPSISWVSLPMQRLLASKQQHARSPRCYLGSPKKKYAEENEAGLNEIHTSLRKAVEKEDYIEAGRLSGILADRIYPEYSTLSSDDKKACRRRMSWSGLGGAPWLIDRLNSLNFTFPTTIQINSFQAVNAILSEDQLGGVEQMESLTLEERISKSQSDMGIVVSGTTGSGKSLSYAVPLLSTLSDTLFLRQRLRISDEEAVGDTAGDLVDRISVVTSPRLSSTNRKQTRPKGVIATGASIATLGRSGSDITSPVALVVVPTRELGVQTAMLLYTLVGGNIKDSPTAHSGKANMFKYKGPKGVRIACVLDDEEASFGLKLQTDIAITTPQYVGKLISDGDLKPSKLRVIVYDEADLALEATSPRDLKKLFDDNEDDREQSRLTLLVGASVTQNLANVAVGSKILPEGKSYIATATAYSPLVSSPLDSDTAQRDVSGDNSGFVKDLKGLMYPGLKHERVVLKDSSGLLTLTRLLRKELQDYDEAGKARGTNQSVQRPRVVVFFPDEVQAKAAISPLRDAMWGEHSLCVLLPKTGVGPLDIMEKFKRNETSVLLATANSVRGLDFPALTHVYTLYLPISDPREYLHLAGRVGRVGHQGEGRVISILKQDEAHKMDELAKLLDFQFTDLDAPETDTIARTADGNIDEDAIDLERLRRSLEDTLAFAELDPADTSYEGKVNENVNETIDAELVDNEEEDGGAFQ